MQTRVALDRTGDQIQIRRLDWFEESASRGREEGMDRLAQPQKNTMRIGAARLARLRRSQVPLPQAPPRTTSEARPQAGVHGARIAFLDLPQNVAVEPFQAALVDAEAFVLGLLGIDILQIHRLIGRVA